ncbi:MAG: hypothetical protein HYS77_06785 [Candidatus Rokubacteria bacterium]|nr:hypothetical protein [Candidatus Rokubacteria bacterium]
MMGWARGFFLISLVTAALLAPAWGAELKTIHGATVKDVVVTLLSESGQWMAGPNSFVLEFVFAKTGDGQLGRAGGQGLRAVLRQRPVAGMRPGHGGH